jgi:hypothetical protein
VNSQTNNMYTGISMKHKPRPWPHTDTKQRCMECGEQDNKHTTDCLFWKINKAKNHIKKGKSTIPVN